MSKKRNIAMVMAAATVATSVAPVFALESQNVEAEALVKEVEAKLAVKYADSKVDGETTTPVPTGQEYKNSVYRIEATAKTVTNTTGTAFTANTPVESAAHLRTLIEKAEIKGEAVSVVITDKGHQTVDGKIVAKGEGKNYTNQAELDAQFAEVSKVLEAKTGDDLKITNGSTADNVVIGTVAVTFDKLTAGNKINGVTITPDSGLTGFTTPVTLAASDAKIDTTKVMVSGTPKAISEVASADKANITGFATGTGTYTAEELHAQFAGYAKYKDMVNNDVAKIQSNNGTEIASVKALTDGSGLKYEITLVGDTDETITIKATDAKLDFTTGVDKDGKEYVISEIRDEATAKKIVGFKLAAGTDSVDLPSRVVGRLVANGLAVSKEEFNLSTFKTENGYTEAGKELAELLKLASTKTITVTKNGKVYQMAFNKNATNNLNINAVKEGGYALNIDLKVAENGKTLPTVENVQLLVKSNAQAELAALKDVIVKGTDLTTAKYGTLAGNTRFETAVEISKAGFVAENESATATKAKAQAIVLVGENAVVDGLASAPLAAQKTAPILLTKKDSVPTETMNEIKRLVAKGAQVYLVGGENTISKSVEAQLAKEMNANIERLAGNDRYETSLEIAGKLTVSSSTRAFVVGGEGLADAMSIAAVAAKDAAPIIVTPAAGLTKDAKAYLTTKTDINDVDVVGGTTKVSTQVLKDITAIRTLPVERVSGADRNDTNAKVVEKYFYTDARGGSVNTAKLSNVYAAKDADTQLVDALAAAPLAGKNNAAIVLATNDLTKAQDDSVKKASTGTKTLTQIGNGVASTVTQKILKALGL